MTPRTGTIKRIAAGINKTSTEISTEKYSVLVALPLKLT